MVNNGLQLIGFAVALLGWFLSIVTTFMPTWNKNDLQGEVIEAVRRNNGLWVRCTTQATGYWTCDDYDAFFLGLPAALQGSRATACISMIMGFFGTVLCAFGLDCTKVADGNPKLKARMVIVAGILHAIGGISIGVAVSWFAANVLQDYYNIALQNATKFVYGEALFVGWASMVLSFIAGLLLCCSSWNSDDEDVGRTYTYNPPKPKPNTAEYI